MINVTTSNHTHTVTIASHTHNVTTSNHTHTVTFAITGGAGTANVQYTSAGSMAGFGGSGSDVLLAQSRQALEVEKPFRLLVVEQVL